MSEAWLVRRRGRLVSYGWCLVVLCVASSFLDCAVADGFDSAPLLQLPFLDGEETDPSDSTAGSLLHDQLAAGAHVFFDEDSARGILFASAPFRPRSVAVSLLLTSRPPPLS